MKGLKKIKQERLNQKITYHKIYMNDEIENKSESYNGTKKIKK